MVDEHVVERAENAGHSLESLRSAIDKLIERGNPQWSEYRVADVGGKRTLTARWRVEQCWADDCERIGTRVIMPNEYDDPFAKFCDRHSWEDVSDDVD